LTGPVFLPFFLTVVLAAMALGCGRPIDRPLEGAQPPRPGEAAAGPPRPLIAALALPSPSPSESPLPIATIATSPSPSPSPPGRNPIISALNPGQNASVPPGNVTLSARVAGSSDLVEASLALDNGPVQPEIRKQDARTWVVAYSARLEAGQYTARIRATDRDGRAGGFTWQFTVEPTDDQPAATPVPSPRPTVTRPPATTAPTRTPAPRTRSSPPTPTPAGNQRR
jgi:hypothetical protein